MFDRATMELNVEPLILGALREDITSEDVSTNCIMRDQCPGNVELICKQDGVICGLQVFERVFTLLDPETEVVTYVKDGDKVEKGQKLADIRGDIRVLLSGERTALNYLQRMSGVAKAIAMAKEYAPFVRKIEVEVENLEMTREAVNAGADIIMLDNMDHDTMAEAIGIIDGKAEIEISGNVDEVKVEMIRDLKVDYVSSGALTHSSPILDLSLKNMRRI